MNIRHISSVLSLALLGACASSQSTGIADVAPENAAPQGQSAVSESPGELDESPGESPDVLPSNQGAQAQTSKTLDPVDPAATEKAPVETQIPLPDEQPSSAPLPSGTKVLHVGDSFAGALGKPLGKLLEDAGVHSVLKHTDASYLTDWAWDKKLQKYLWKYNPDLVIVTLGANELGIGSPKRREKTIKKIISTIGDRPCLWVAIPLWNGPQNGLLEVIRESSSPCVYMDSNELLDVKAMPRMKDGIHPTSQARTEWAEFVLGWLKEHRDPAADKPWVLEP